MGYSGEIMENATKDGKHLNDEEKEELIRKVTSRDNKDVRT